MNSYSKFSITQQSLNVRSNVIAYAVDIKNIASIKNIVFHILVWLSLGIKNINKLYMNPSYREKVYYRYVYSIFDSKIVACLLRSNTIIEGYLNKEITTSFVDRMMREDLVMAKYLYEWFSEYLLILRDSDNLYYESDFKIGGNINEVINIYTQKLLDFTNNKNKKDTYNDITDVAPFIIDIYDRYYKNAIFDTQIKPKHLDFNYSICYPGEDDYEHKLPLLSAYWGKYEPFEFMDDPWFIKFITKELPETDTLFSKLEDVKNFANTVSHNTYLDYFNVYKELIANYDTKYGTNLQSKSWILEEANL